MAARQKAIPPSKPLDVSDDVWAEAIRCEDTVRSLAAAGTNSKATIRAAADALGLDARRATATPSPILFPDPANALRSGAHVLAVEGEQVLGIEPSRRWQQSSVA